MGLTNNNDNDDDDNDGDLMDHFSHIGMCCNNYNDKVTKIEWV